MMRPLTAKDIVSEVGPQTYAANEVTRIYASPAWDAGIEYKKKTGIQGIKSLQFGYDTEPSCRPQQYVQGACTKPASSSDTC